MRAGHFLTVPYITGFTSGEGIMRLAFAWFMANSSRWEELDERFEDIFRPEMPPGLRTEGAVCAMRSFYFGDRALRGDAHTLRKLAEMSTDLFVAVSSTSSARLMTQSGASVYLYISHEGPSPDVTSNLYNASEGAGPPHGEDDLLHLFQLAQRDEPSRALPNVEAAARNRRVKLLANFAKDGDPTPSHLEQQWPLYTSKEEHYLDMDMTFTVRHHVLGERIAFWRQLAKCKTPGICEDDPVVPVEQGLLRGRAQQSVAGCNYYSWQGIPYAKPPVGPLRFKDSLPPESWKGVRDALKDGHKCSQDSGLGFVGDEDCLVLNVFTPRRPLWLADSLPVMLWIHGGGFVTGSSQYQGLGPDFLVCDDILFVSFNYRLGVMGFLYLEAAASGNAGLKDQVMAQRWVKRNIAAFGGDPNRITLAGESAGSASVHLHMLSPMTKGLFQRAIAQSGTALNPWAIQTTPVQTAKNTADLVGCDIGDYFKIVECLRGVPADELIEAAVKTGEKSRLVTFTFVPTPDYPVPGIEIFLPAPAINMVVKQSHHAVPYLTGFNTEESILQLAYVNFRDPEIAEKLDASWNTTILPDLRVASNSSKADEALQRLRQFFMNGKSLSSDTLLEFMDMVTDIGFAEGTYCVIRNMAEAAKAPLHLYSFGVDDALNMLKLQLNITDIPGAGHADDLGYLFQLSFLPDVPANSTAALARNRMVKMWSNFVKTGEPTPEDDPLLGARWPPYTAEERYYLNITEQLEAKKDLNAARVKFWEDFYRNYGNELS